MASRVIGGKKIERILAEAKRRGGKTIKVGFFATARYEDGTPVAAVAAINEFGAPSKGIPERPFFRRAIKQMDSDGSLRRIVGAGIDPERMELDGVVAGQIGAHAAAQVRESITELRDPANAPATAARKRRKLHGKKGTGGGSNPLIDEGFMQASVSYRVGGGPIVGGAA